MPRCSPVLGGRDPTAGATELGSIQAASSHDLRGACVRLIVHSADLLPGAQGWPDVTEGATDPRQQAGGSGVSEWRSRSALPPVAPAQPASGLCRSEPGMCRADCELAMTVQCLQPCHSRVICVMLPSSPGNPHLSLIRSESRPVMHSARQWALGHADQIKSLSYEY